MKDTYTCGKFWQESCKGLSNVKNSLERKKLCLAQAQSAFLGLLPLTQLI